MSTNWRHAASGRAGLHTPPDRSEPEDKALAHKQADELLCQRALDSTKQARERVATELTAKLVGQLQPNVERESKQYVEKFLDLEREREATSLQTLSTTTLDKLGVIETDLQLRHEREARSDTGRGWAS